MRTNKKKTLVVKSNIKAGLVGTNHNRTVAKKSSLVVKSNIKAGLVGTNHNRAQLACRAASKLEILG